MSFAHALLQWFDRHGRKDLPWQVDPTPYRVWVSEIMLQQTQVTTVIAYYLAFMQRFPDVQALAGASLDEVLHLWSGLGYYARARNLHRSAQEIAQKYAGVFPDTLQAAMELPGIGRSTAGAILSLSLGQHHAILDGNARRVISRYFGVDGDPASPAVIARLWEHAQSCTPHERSAAYTQAIMDLGATVCVRSRPLCLACPLASGCVARREHRQHELPATRTRRSRRVEHTFMLLALREGQVLLERRPPNGIWGGLWSLPQFETLEGAHAWCAARFGASPGSLRALAGLRHTFTHFDLDIEPLSFDAAASRAAMEADRWLWYNPAAPAELGLASPVKRLIEQMRPDIIT
jgi:A/G-specific adenine glycosylase